MISVRYLSFGLLLYSAILSGQSLQATALKALSEGNANYRIEIERVITSDATHRIYVIAQVDDKDNPSGDCHACAPYVGVAILKGGKGRWKVLSANPTVTRVGHSGLLPGRIFLRHLGKTEAISLHDEDIHGGVYSDSDNFLMETSKGIRSVFSVWHAYSNKGQCRDKDFPEFAECYRFRTIYQLEPRLNDYSDILEISQGTRLIDDSDKAISFRSQAHYRFSPSNQKFELVEGLHVQ